MKPVGGLRARYLHDSMQQAVHAGMDVLGWFAPNRAHRPIEFLAKPADWDEEIASNSIVVTTRTRANTAFEVGSWLTQDMVVVGVDIYGESDSFANHLANDIRDLLRGRLSVGPRRGSLPILDFSMATPAAIGHAIIGDVRVSRIPPRVNRPYTQHWFGVDAELFDTYYDSSEDP